MITVNDILTQFQTLKAKINVYYTLIYNEVNSDADLSGLTSTSKTSEFNLWMWMFAAMSAIMDGVWADRQQQISDKVALGIPGTDRWLQIELFKFQYGDSLLWDDVTGRYHYAVIDPAKQIIKRCAIISSGGITAIKVAKISGSNLVALTNDELTAFRSFMRQIQWAGAKIAQPTSFNSDKLNAPMTVYYDGTKKRDDIKAIVEPAWREYLSLLPFNAEYSVNKHGDFVEGKSTDIKEVNMGAVQVRADAGSFINVNRIFTPASGYLERDPAISFNDMITYIAV
jgi:hypothetical protein